MNKNIFVFPGWGSPEKFYIDFFKKNIENIIILSNTDIEKNRKILNNNKGEKIFFGWSLGTMMILKLLKEINPSKIILISPTHCFYETMPLVVIKKMRRDILKNKLKTLFDFNLLNFKEEVKAIEYMDKYREEINKIEVNELYKGLEILMEENLSEITLDNYEALIIISSEDKIIPMENSLKMSSKFKRCKVEIIDNTGHNMIFEKENIIKEIIEKEIL